MPGPTIERCCVDYPRTTHRVLSNLSRREKASRSRSKFWCDSRRGPELGARIMTSLWDACILEDVLNVVSVKLGVTGKVVSYQRPPDVSWPIRKRRKTQPVRHEGAFVSPPQRLCSTVGISTMRRPRRIAWIVNSYSIV